MKRVKNIFMKKRNIIVALVLFLAIGFAAVTTTLVINGTGIFGTNTDDFDVYFSKAILDGVENNALISQDGKSITYETANLEIVGDESVLEYTITNNSTQYDAEVSINCELETNDYVRVDNSLEDELIEAKSEGKGTLTAHLFKTSVNEKELVVTCNITASATEREEDGSEVVNPDEINTYSLLGNLVDEDGNNVSNNTIVAYSNPIYTTTDANGYLFVEGLEKGSHTIYLMGTKSIEDLKEMSESEIAAEAISKAEFTTNSINIMFDNGYTIKNLVLTKALKVEVTFDANEGELESTTKEVIKGLTYGDLPTPTREGYVFLGWFTEKENGLLIEEDTKVTVSQDQVLYANWRLAEVVQTIMYNNEKQSLYPEQSDFVKVEEVSCKNNTEASWNSSTWKLDYPQYSDDECTIYFVDNHQNAAEYITNLAATSTMIATDDADKNPRYYGADPANYVNYNGETWRIIGVFDVATTVNGSTQKRVKLIRSNHIGGYSYDSSAANINTGYGINEWSQADIKVTLNTTYLTGGTGICYGDAGNVAKSCVFGSGGINPLSSDAQSYISNAEFYLGASPVQRTDNTSNRTETASQMYSYERGTTTGKNCTSSSTTCTDSVTRTTRWAGLVGLMYVSDYAYATGGGSTTSRSVCLSKPLYFWNNTSYVSSDCYINNWLYDSTGNQRTINPMNWSGSGTLGSGVSANGNVNSPNVFYANSIRPVVYLNENIKLSGGNGTINNMYQLTK